MPKGNKQTPTAPANRPEHKISSPDEDVVSKKAKQLIDMAIKAFEKELPGLMREHEGRWVAYVGQERLPFIEDDKDELLKKCYGAGHKDTELFVAMIQPGISPVYEGWES